MLAVIKFYDGTSGFKNLLGFVSEEVGQLSRDFLDQ